ncbi:MerR family transcriptional regulator [Lachnobacterium bovis]|uniref:MerR family transcriptional regulator n=1 Tax=Lachnobacterium bovis TaxID=140626 RepID=UPI000688954E|nr:MerR family transcriptional regulator [Lachnobacterium bovis]
MNEENNVNIDLSKYYTSGQFAKMANVSTRTIRYYDTQNILKPSYINKNTMARYYTDEDFAKLQQILLFKYLGFSLDEIKELTINDLDYHFLLNSLKLQSTLIQDKIEQMQLVQKAILDTTSVIEKNKNIDWSQMLNLIHLTNMQTSLKTQYQNANNITSRINLHQKYSTNTEKWFPWIFKHCKFSPHEKILEVGCGTGSLWLENSNLIPSDIDIFLSDISRGMLRDARRCLSTLPLSIKKNITFKAFDCQKIPFPDNTFDTVIANHVLFYCTSFKHACLEINRVLKPNGKLICSTYSKNHMHELNELVNEFDSRIILSANNLYETFGLENGKDLLDQTFISTEKFIYNDELVINASEPIIEYILSCHGNQNQYILDNYKEFRSYVDSKIKPNFRVTKEACIFISHKKEN